MLFSGENSFEYPPSIPKNYVLIGQFCTTKCKSSANIQHQY